MGAWAIIRERGAWPALGAAALSACGTLGPSAASAGSAERVVMPFMCDKTGARLTLTPAAPRSFEIAGLHDVRRVPVCLGGQQTGAPVCAIIEFHRFDVMCGRKRVAWAEIAAAVGANAPRSHIKGPPGFAPLADAGGRLVVALQETRPARLTGAALVPVISQPLPDLATPEPAANAPAAGTAEIGAATAAASSADENVSDRQPSGLSTGLWSLAAIISALALGVAASRRWPDRARQVRAKGAGVALAAIEALERHVPRLGGRLKVITRATAVTAAQSLMRVGTFRLRPLRAISDLQAANAVTAVSQMLAATETRIACLTNAGPLVDVLSQEIIQLQQRLAALTATASESAEQAGKASPAFRNLMRDIERVRRIADSAAVSMGAGRSASRIPVTRSEAFELLGLNPDAPVGTLKKVADGLRMSWHPDHARDSTDLAEREARIKAINAAVDLINGKRAA